jgi:5-hydroxyisourate hydrolase
MTGKPAAALKIELFSIEDDGQYESLIVATTNVDGRVDKPLLNGDDFKPGTYRLDFHAGDYLRSHDRVSDFLDIIPIQFTVTDTSRHYHVPLLLSAYGYSTYRGS